MCDLSSNYIEIENFSLLLCLYILSQSDETSIALRKRLETKEFVDNLKTGVWKNM